MKTHRMSTKLKKQLIRATQELDSIFKESEQANTSDHKILILTEQLYCKLIRPLINNSLKLLSIYYRPHNRNQRDLFDVQKRLDPRFDTLTLPVCAKADKRLQNDQSIVDVLHHFNELHFQLLKCHEINFINSKSPYFNRFSNNSEKIIAISKKLNPVQTVQLPPLGATPLLNFLTFILHIKQCTRQLCVTPPVNADSFSELKSHLRRAHQSLQLLPTPTSTQFNLTLKLFITIAATLCKILLAPFSTLSMPVCLALQCVLISLLKYNFNPTPSNTLLIQQPLIFPKTVFKTRQPQHACQQASLRIRSIENTKPIRQLLSGFLSIKNQDFFQKNIILFFIPGFIDPLFILPSCLTQAQQAMKNEQTLPLLLSLFTSLILCTGVVFNFNTLATTVAYFIYASQPYILSTFGHQPRTCGQCDLTASGIRTEFSEQDEFTDVHWGLWYANQLQNLYQHHSDTSSLLNNPDILKHTQCMLRHYCFSSRYFLLQSPIMQLSTFLLYNIDYTNAIHRHNQTTPRPGLQYEIKPQARKPLVYQQKLRERYEHVFLDDTPGEENNNERSHPKSPR